MIFKIVVFTAAVFAYQVNAQVGSFIRPFATGFSNGLSEMAKPFVQLGQSVMAPPGGHRPQMSQWMSYPSQIIPQVQGAAYEGYEAVASGMPGVSYFQVVRPNPAFKPQMQYYPIPAGQPGLLRPTRPYPAPVPAPAPAPAPASSSSEESGEVYVPSNLLIEPNPPEVQVPTPEVPMTLESNFEVPTLQRPLPIVEDKE